MSTSLAITTSRSERLAERLEALALAVELGAPFVPRRGRALPTFLADEGLEAAVSVQQPRPVWQRHDGARFAWHPNMAVGRLRAIRGGALDRLVAAAELRPGDRVLDATLGLAADAIVMADAVGPEGGVVGLESSPILAALARRGLASYEHPLAAPMRRVRVVAGDHRALLAPGSAWAAARWEVICFDPMFDSGVARSAGIAGLRALAETAPLNRETVTRARTLVERAVVVKAHRGARLVDELGDAEILSGAGRVIYLRFRPLEGSTPDVALG